MSDTTQTHATEATAVGAPVERPVRPIAWCSRPNGGSFVSDEARDNVSIYREVYNVPLYDQSALDAAVAAERERCAKLCQQVAEENTDQDSYHWHGCMDCKAAIETPNAALTGPQRRKDSHEA